MIEGEVYIKGKIIVIIIIIFFICVRIVLLLLLLKEILHYSRGLITFHQFANNNENTNFDIFFLKRIYTSSIFTRNAVNFDYKDVQNRILWIYTPLKDLELWYFYPVCVF